jgi:hypothetical protein
VGRRQSRPWSSAEADDDVAVAIAMVTIFGTVAMVALPLLQGPLGLTDTQLGARAGASVHEVGQVVAAASPAGSAAVGGAVVVKLTRVLLLAPVVAGVSVLRRRLREESTTAGDAALPALVPLFAGGFLACVALRSTGAVPQAVLLVIGQLQTLALGAALFGMGTGVHVATLWRSSGGARCCSPSSPRSWWRVSRWWACRPWSDPRHSRSPVAVQSSRQLESCGAARHDQDRGRRVPHQPAGHASEQDPADRSVATRAADKDLAV